MFVPGIVVIGISTVFSLLCPAASLDLEFTSHGINKLHVSKKGYQAIDCGAVNYCQIRWYRHGDGGVLHEYPAWDLGPFSVFLLEYNNQSLRFKSADQVATGNYTCIVSNATHSISRTTILKVDGEMIIY